MKLLTILLLVPFLSFGQSLVTNNIDEFTKKSVKETGYETLTMNKEIFSKVKLAKIDETHFLKFIFASGTATFIVPDSGKLMIKFKNDSVLTLTNNGARVSCSGCGTTGMIGSTLQGVSLSFPLNDQQVSLIQSAPCSKIRVYTTTGYLESDVKEKNSTLLQKSYELVK